ncbi:MAG: hypothetical protein BMS9Abin02_1055 [Anaerolineae bacterium]|nr:MAG: hypothetical protein BMS9Abin02_1055 [Anaerolineae bacterium]
MHKFKYLLLTSLGLFFIIVFIPADPDHPLPGPTVREEAVQDLLSISNISDNREDYTEGEIPQFDKFEITFDVNTVAANLQFPYDPSPPPGIDPVNIPLHNGVTVDAIFTDPDGNTYQQPAFYYQFFDDNNGITKTGWDEKEHNWFYPTGEFAWKVRFSPHLPGDWQVYLKAEDETGSTTTQSNPINFKVVQSDNRGFLKVSQNDLRYFEFDDGSPFYTSGIHTEGHPILTDNANFETFSENGIDFLRTWISDLYGAAWPEWIGTMNIYEGYLPRPGIVPFKNPSNDDVTMTLRVDYEIDGNTVPYDACRIQILGDPEAVKPNTDYKIEVTYWGENISGPRNPDFSDYGLVAKIGGWNSECFDPEKLNSKTVVITNYGTNTGDWGTIEGTWNSGSNDFIQRIHIGIENVDQGEVYIKSISVREDLGSGQFGPEILMQSSMEYQLYYPQLRSFAIDKIFETIEQNDLYLKMVIQDRSDKIFYKINDDGTFVLPGEPNNKDGYYGVDYEINKIRWLQRAYWRYLQARWGYSPNIHSWEFTNEGDPDPVRTSHYAAADLFGRYMKCEVFGIPVPDTNDDGQPFEGDFCNYDHPNAHMVTTSFWRSYPAADFWVNPDYPNVDYADLHAYVSTGWMNDPAHETDAALFHLDYSSWARTVTDEAAAQNAIATKPIVRGETGIDFVDQQTEQPDLALDMNGVWLHNLLWSTLDPGSMSEIYWWRSNLENRAGPDGQAGLYEIFKYLRAFTSPIPINNGQYEDIQATLTDPELRATGQKDTANDRAHLWVQNKNHTWRNVVDSVNGITGLSGAVGVGGFTPNKKLDVQWHEFTTQGTPAISCSAVTSDEVGDIDLALPGDPSVADVGIKIGDYSEFELVHNLQVVIDDPPLSVVPGETLTYSLTYTNSGYIEATGVTVTETVPANTSFNPSASSSGWDCDLVNNPGSVCTYALGSLDGGESGSIKFAVDLHKFVPAGVNNVHISAEIGEDDASCRDENGADNSDSALIPVIAAPDLQLDIDPAVETAVIGKSLAYTLTYSNVGNQDAAGVIITDSLPAGAAFKADASKAGWACTPDVNAGSSCTITVGAVPAGPSGVISFTIDIPSPSQVTLSQITNTAEIRDDGDNGLDPNPADNIAAVVTPAWYNLYLIFVTGNSQSLVTPP